MIDMTAPLPITVISDASKKRLKANHPWIFSNEIQLKPDIEPGAWTEVQDRSGHSIGTGYYNPHTLIAIRILSFKKEVNLAERIAAAQAIRKRHYETDVYRLIYGESDRLPGLIVDQYKETLVVQILTAGMEKLKAEILDHLLQIAKPRRVILRNDSPYRKLEGLKDQVEWFYGDPVHQEWIEIDGLRFLVNYETGQKTGFFLDQRENRKRLLHYGDADSLLDVFSYTGAWAIYGASAGIRNVIAVDSSQEALRKADQNAEQNGYRITTIVADAPEFLRESAAGAVRYDRIVLDPPAFCKSKRHLSSAIRAYMEINLRAMKSLAPGGLLFTCSCSQPLNPELFLQVLHQAATASGRSFYLRELLFQPPDHPILMNFPESHYLKCAVLEVA
jgi:23S rRNA (cytosine1962-C5)-methyltransferase